MTIFHACTPPGRVSGSTVRPLTRRGLSRMRGSPTSGAPTRSSSGTRYACASGSSSSRLGRRCPFSSRDRVLFEMPVRAATSVNVSPRARAPRRSRGPTRSSAAAIAVAPSDASAAGRCRPASLRVTTHWTARFPETATSVVAALSRVPRFHVMNEYDVVVIGGGAAGLSAALVLTRARRRVAVVDAGQPRNAPAAHMHGFLGSDGLAARRAAGRRTGRGRRVRRRT